VGYEAAASSEQVLDSLLLSSGLSYGPVLVFKVGRERNEDAEMQRRDDE